MKNSQKTPAKTAEESKRLNDFAIIFGDAVKEFQTSKKEYRRFSASCAYGIVLDRMRFWNGRHRVLADEYRSDTLALFLSEYFDRNDSLSGGNAPKICPLNGIEDYRNCITIILGMWQNKKVEEYLASRKAKRLFKKFYREYYEPFIDLTWSKCSNVALNFNTERPVENAMEAALNKFYKKYSDYGFCVGEVTPDSPLRKLGIANNVDRDIKDFLEMSITFKNFIFKSDGQPYNCQTVLDAFSVMHNSETQQDMSIKNLIEHWFDTSTLPKLFFVDASLYALCGVFSYWLREDLNEPKNKNVRNLLNDYSLYYIRNLDYSLDFVELTMTKYLDMQRSKRSRKPLATNYMHVNNDASGFGTISKKMAESYISEQIAALHIAVNAATSIAPGINQAYKFFIERKKMYGRSNPFNVEDDEFVDISACGGIIQNMADYFMLFYAEDGLLSFLPVLNKWIAHDTDCMHHRLVIFKYEMFTKPLYRMLGNDDGKKINNKWQIKCDRETSEYTPYIPVNEVNEHAYRFIDGVDYTDKDYENCLLDFVLDGKGTVEAYVEHVFEEDAKSHNGPLFKTKSVEDDMKNLVAAALERMLETAEKISGMQRTVVETLCEWANDTITKLKIMKEIDPVVEINEYFTHRCSPLVYLDSTI